MRLIDADALIDNKLERMTESFGIDFGRADVTFGINDIEHAPTVEAEPIRHGQWEYWAGNLVKCSACGFKYADYLECDNYCGNCGAKMDEEKENDQQREIRHNKY